MGVQVFRRSGAQALKPKSKTSRRGFTLIELLVVIVILAILAAVVIQRVTHRTEDARDAKAISEIKTFDDALETYKLDKRNYPTGDDGLRVLEQGYIKGKVPNDPWGNPYIYTIPGNEGRDYDIVSAGKDGQLGTDDDIKSWDLQGTGG